MMTAAEISPAIYALMEDGRTGTVIAVFDDNSLGRICLVDGRITSARLQNKDGMAAMKLAQQMNLLSVKFHNNCEISRAGEWLSAESGNSDSPTADQPRGNQPVSGQQSVREMDQKVPKQAVTKTSGPLSELGRRRLNDLLAEYIGPVSPLVMSDLKENVNFEMALTIVSREFENTRRADKFVAAARKIL